MEIFRISTRFRCVLPAAVFLGLSTVSLAAGQGGDWTECATRVNGHQLQLTNADKSRTFASI